MLVTPLQLANAYATIADGGVMHTPSFIKGDDNPPKQIISAHVANELIQMMETVTGPGSTAPQARIANYAVAGKTGTGPAGLPRLRARLRSQRRRL